MVSGFHVKLRFDSTWSLLELDDWHWQKSGSRLAKLTGWRIIDNANVIPTSWSHWCRESVYGVLELKCQSVRLQCQVWFSGSRSPTDFKTQFWQSIVAHPIHVIEDTIVPNVVGLVHPGENRKGSDCYWICRVLNLRETRKLVLNGTLVDWITFTWMYPL